MKKAWILLTAVGALVIAVYAYTAQSGILESVSPDAADTYYNLLVQGFRAGQLSLKKEVPPGLAQLADPYDPTVNARYRLAPYWTHDLSYYKGRLYLYFGVTPAVILFWPYVALTGGYLLHREAVIIFCAIGFLASVGLLGAMWRRYFAEVNVVVVAACALALGLATGALVLMSRSEVYEVSISCGYMLTMLALAGIWCALHEPEPRKRSGWLAAASVAYGLAVGARPHLLFGSVILLVPVIQAWREERKSWMVLLAAVGPIVLIGLGLMLYNDRRFDNPFEFGQRYQLAGEQQLTQRFFSLQYFWFNFRVYFLEPVRWSGRFPFVQGIVVPPVPPGHGRVEEPFGVLTNIPVAWLALAAPFVWRKRSAEAGILRWFITMMILFFGICALSLCLFRGANARYELEFLPALVWLAVAGIFGLEQALSDRPVWRCVARLGWGALLGFSVAFNLLAGFLHCAETARDTGAALEQAGKVQDAIGQYERALWIKPDYAESHFNLGNALMQVGRLSEAVEQYEEALRFKPEYSEAHNNLGNALLRTGKIEEAIGQYEQALRLMPDSVVVHYTLGNALLKAGRLSEAAEQYEQAVRIKPDYAKAHYGWGLALERAGKREEAIGHFEQAVRLKPDFTEARDALARLGAGQ